MPGIQGLQCPRIGLQCPVAVALVAPGAFAESVQLRSCHGQAGLVLNGQDVEGPELLEVDIRVVPPAGCVTPRQRIQVRKGHLDGLVEICMIRGRHVGHLPSSGGRARDRFLGLHGGGLKGPEKDEPQHQTPAWKASVDTGFRTIDCHAHVGRFEGYDLSESTLLSELEEGGIALALASNIDGATVPGKTRGLPMDAANRAMAAVVRRNPARLRALAWGRPDAGLSPDGVRSHLQGLSDLRLNEVDTGGWTPRVFTGLKLHPEMNQYPADAFEVDPFLQASEAFGWPVVVHSDGKDDRASPERIHAMARRHPRVPVVLYHTGFGGPHEPAVRAAERAAASGDANLFLETAQLPPAAFLRAVERVGPRRVLFGTDATYYGAGHYRTYAPLVEAIRSLGEVPARAILHDNAFRLFGLEGTSNPESPNRTHR
ncbi:MAG: hypothetical protein EA352_03345 [Gemmatimonadales bacterium]|nr:MAG: hypothetical protein EA352_03345 [Gemmatimonadales bacterium]